MKTRLPQSVCALVAFTSAALSMGGIVRAADDIPVGYINASPGIAAVGAFPKLDWQITYPTKLEDLVKIEKPGTIRPKTDLKMEVRLLGAGVTISYADGSHMSFASEEAYYSYNDGGWQKVFSGTNKDVNQSAVIKSQTVSSGKSIRFGGRFWDVVSNPRGEWSHFYSSNDGTQNVQVLKDGDSIPTTYNIANSPTLEQFIKPYLDAGGKVDIGPMDMIVMCELTHTESQRYQTGYDLQDLVFLVTFSE
ncbi:hypothetical protein [Haloferula sargassicola]|uniref:Uncharacterized protein n=1 Tax=Haloferula sargassicola TaxID=490096 RepID=A0ABP9UYT8_9BACT